VGEAKISPRDAAELEACFAAHARDLFGLACAPARGDRALAGDLVQAAFEAAARAWPALRCLAEQQRRSWLHSTLANIAVSGFRREAVLRDPLPRIEIRYRKTADDPPGQACSSIALERCWRISERDAVPGATQAHHAARAGPPVQPGRSGRSAVMRGGQETGRSPEDILLSRLYQQVSKENEAQFSASYDIAAGLDRYRTWLGGQGEGTVWSADLAVIELYSVHYRSLVRLAAVLVRDTPTAEEVVQDAFIAMHDGWQRLKDADKALAYLRQAVVNRSRSVLRHRLVVERNLQKPPPDMPSAEHGALTLLERSAVVAALRDLPDRQREAIVLRYYADLSEAEIAAAMKISRGAVKSHTARGMAALRAALEQDS